MSEHAAVAQDLNVDYSTLFATPAPTPAPRGIEGPASAPSPSNSIGQGPTGVQNDDCSQTGCASGDLCNVATGFCEQDRELANDMPLVLIVVVVLAIAAALALLLGARL
jgi:hypothetical protein